MPSKYLAALPQGFFALYDHKNTPAGKHTQVIEAFLDAEAVPIIIRSAGFSEGEYAAFIHEIDIMAQEMDFDYLIHHHVGLFNETRAVGVHLNAQSSSIGEARHLIGADKLIGFSAHSLAEALNAQEQGADYIVLGSLFSTPKTQAGHPVLGVDTLRLACRRLSIPVYAIGGITPDNLLSVRNAGAKGFCALRAIYQGGEVEHNTAKLKLMWEKF